MLIWENAEVDGLESMLATECVDENQGMLLDLMRQLQSLLRKSGLAAEELEPLLLLIKPIQLRIAELQRQLRETDLRLQRQSTRDSLTGLWCLGSIQELLAKELARTVREQRSFAVVMVDVDDLKRVNDYYGHQMGDEVLKTVAQRLLKVCRKEDSVGCYSGGKFLVVLSAGNDREMLALGDRFRKCVAEQVVCPKIGFELEMTVSVGVGICRYPQGSSVDAMIQLAIDALVLAKKAGRNRVRQRLDRVVSIS
ncbi:MAG: GGDEF domain-containing protein [Gammaproteobacteria bacterium]|nr:GGDEF domain-containing protein [Gammaproteobacteria bacterium]